MKRGNREATIQRKIRTLKSLKGSPEDMIKEVLSKNWCDKNKQNAIDAICQYAEFLGLPLEKPSFRAYDNREMFVPTPEMVKQFIYRIRKLEVKARVLIAVETGATASEICNLRWKDVNLQNKTITITGVKGHRTWTYKISDELCHLLMQIPRGGEKIFNIKPDNINKAIEDYRRRLAKETGNSDFLKVHFHTFRHFAISWKYFKTKDIVETQRFARHCNIQNTLKYVHIVKQWIRENEYDVVYANSQEELTKCLREGYELVTKTEWGYCLRKPKPIT
ncbi:MAG: site-specific integrase [Nitrososphaeria archaeon]